MRGKLEQQLARDPAFKHEHLFFEGTIVYVADNVHHDLARLLKKLVVVLGGFYLD
jgi:hypothetical protein